MWIPRSRSRRVLVAGCLSTRTLVLANVPLGGADLRARAIVVWRVFQVWHRMAMENA